MLFSSLLVTIALIVTVLLVVEQQPSLFIAHGLPFQTTHTIMPYLCLERCGYNKTQVQSQLDDIKQNNELFLQYVKNYTNPNATEQPALVNAIAFEALKLEANGSIYFDSVSDASEMIRSTFQDQEEKYGYKMRLVPMVTSVDIEQMRTVFQSEVRERFVLQLLYYAVDLLHADGVNVDFEPLGAAQPSDARHYSDFINYVAGKAAVYNLTTSACLATYRDIWNYTLFAEEWNPIQIKPTSSIPFPYGMTMTTYPYTGSYFKTGLEHSVGNFSKYGTPLSGAPPHSIYDLKNRLIVGLDNWVGTDYVTKERLKYQADLLSQDNICQIAIWMTPIQEMYWDFLFEIGKRCLYAGGG